MHPTNAAWCAVNSQLQADGSIKRLDTVDISVAVATPTGLITPIVPNADQKGVVSISNTIKVPYYLLTQCAFVLARYPF